MDVEQGINIAVFWKNTSRKHQKWRKKPEKGTKNGPFRLNNAVNSGDSHAKYGDSSGPPAK